MAENNEELNKIKEMTSAEQFLESIEGKADPFAGYSLEDLQSVASVVKGFGDSKAKEAVVAMINAEIAKQQNNQKPAQEQETQEQKTPQSAEEPLEDIEQFITQPSYSVYRDYTISAKSMAEKSKNIAPAGTFENFPKLQEIVNNSQKVIDLVSKEEITPESAVFLKDYISILRDAKTLEGAEKEKIDALEIAVDKQLEVFDKENGIIDEKTNKNKLENISAGELESRENDWYNVANKVTNKSGDELDEIIKNLAVQELKIEDDLPFYKEVIKHAAEQTGIAPEKIKDLYTKGLKGESLTKEETQLFDTMEALKEAMKSKVFADKFSDLKAQFEATKLTELAKLTAEELYPIKPDMSEQEKAEAQKKREAYLDKWLESGKKSEQDWIEENVLRTLKTRHPDTDDNKLLNEYAQEYKELKDAYTNVAQEISNATKAAYVTKVDLLANRTARLTKSPDINPNTKDFLQDFATNNPKSYVAGKIALTIGKSVAISSSVKAVFGFKGMAAYSAYNTHKAIKKSWAKYKEQAVSNGKTANLAGFWGYLKDNPNERVTIVSGIAKTTIMSTLAVAGTALGFDNVPGVSAALVTATNAAATTAKVVYNRGKIKAGFKKLYEKAKNSPKFKKWGLIGLVGAGAAAATYMLLPDETKEKISEALGNVFSKEDDENTTDLDNKAVKGAETKALSGNETPTAPKAQPGAEVSALTESDTKLLVTDCKMGPDPIVAKLEQMGVLSQEDKAKLIDAGDRNGGVASRVLASYLGHPYDKTEVPVHASLTAEQQQELNQFLHSSEYQQQCDACNAPANASKLAELKEKVANGNNGESSEAEANIEQRNANIDSNINGNNSLNEGGENTTPTPEASRVGVSVSRNKAFLGITTKHNVGDAQIEVKAGAEDYQTLRNAAISQHLQDDKFKHMSASMTDENGNETVAKVTVRGKSADNLSVKTKITNQDGTTMSEKMVSQKGVISSTYKNNVVADMNGDGVSDNLVGKARFGNDEYAAYKTSDGKEVIVRSQRLSDGSYKEVSRSEVKNAKSTLNQIVKSQRSAFADKSR